MADQNITELPVKTSSGMTSSDYMLGIDSAEGYQMLIKDLGDYIIRNVQVNTIAGANQTLKSALDTLNSNSNLLTGGNTIPNNQDLNALLTPGNYYAYNNVTISNGPVTNFSGIIKVYSSAGQADANYVKQVLSRYDKVEQYERYTYISSGNRVFSTWVLLPSRAEVDALNNIILKGSIESNSSQTLEPILQDGCHTLTLKRGDDYVSVCYDWWSSEYKIISGSIPTGITITKNSSSHNVTVASTRSIAISFELT